MENAKVPTVVDAALRELKQRLDRLYGDRLSGLYLYGSYARGAAHADSDIDVLVVLHGSVQPGAEIAHMGRIVADICLERDLLISVFPVSTAALRERSSPLFANVRREGVLL